MVYPTPTIEERLAAIERWNAEQAYPSLVSMHKVLTAHGELLTELRDLLKEMVTKEVFEENHQTLLSHLEDIEKKQDNLIDLTTIEYEEMWQVLGVERPEDHQLPAGK